VFNETSREMGRALFATRRETTSAGDPRTEALVAVVLDLLMEVEALRAAVVTVSGEASGKDSAYGRAYRSTAYLTHNASGPSSGLDKLLALFYPAEAETDSGGSTGRRAWRERLMLHRLGFSEEEIREYKDEAEQAETFT
jgi:hypothetical protein